MIPDAYEKLDLSKRVILVTGGGRGIGEETSKLLAARGAAVMIADLNESGGHNTVAAITSAGGKAAFYRADVAQEAEVRALVAATIQTFGSLHGAFNNAGIESAGRGLAAVEFPEWQRMIGVNLTGVFLCMKYEIMHMEKHGGGSIVNTTSAAGLVGIPNLGSYVASKHGVVGLTRAASTDYSAKGIRVNCIAPGAIETPMMREAFEDPTVKRHVESSHPIGHVGQSRDIAEAAAWLLSDAAAFVTGICMPVDGGYTSI